MDPLPDARITAALTALPRWTRNGDALERTFAFPSFRDALAWMQDAAEHIERIEHHPEWTNVYDKVRVRLTSHDAGNRITAKDVELAKILDWCLTMRG